MSPTPRQAAATVSALLLSAVAACSPAKPTNEAATAPRGYRVYITNEVSNDLTVIDGPTHRVLATIPIGMRPRGIRASRDGSTLYVAVSGSPIAGPGVDEDTLPPADKSKDGIAVLDVASGKVLRVIAGVSDPEQLEVVGDRLFITSEDTATAVVIESATGKILATLKTGEEPEGVNATPDGRFVFVTSEAHSEVTIIDVSSLTVAATLKVGERPRNTAFSSDSRRAYVAGENDASVTVIDVQNKRILNTGKLADRSFRPMDVTLPGDGGSLFLTGGRAAKVAVLDASSLSLTATIPVGQRPWGMAVSPDGTRIYTANGPSNDVTVIDVPSRQVIATIKAGTRPWSGVAVAAR